MKPTFLNRAALMAMAALVVALGSIARSQSATPPTFRFDPTWPKELPNNWLVGNVVGVGVDSRDNVWITHRPASQAGAEKTPPVLAFDRVSMTRVNSRDDMPGIAAARILVKAAQIERRTA